MDVYKFLSGTRRGVHVFGLGEGAIEQGVLGRGAGEAGGKDESCHLLALESLMLHILGVTKERQASRNVGARPMIDPLSRND
jgi:hypothetical protein